MSCERCTHKNVCKYEEDFKKKQKEIDLGMFKLHCDNYKDNMPVHEFIDFNNPYRIKNPIMNPSNPCDNYKFTC